jgi:tetrahydromethanopterin S-methyltransferase subunit D
MPTTARETLLAAATTKLAAIAGITGLAVERNRRDAVEDFPMIVARDGSSRIGERLTGIDRLVVSVDVECYASGATPAAAGQKLNELYGAAAAALLADPTLGVGGFDVREVDGGEPLIDTGDAAVPVASLSARFELEAWVRTDDPYTIGP